MEKVRDFWNAQSEMGCLQQNSSPQGSGIYVGEEAKDCKKPEGMDDSKENSDLQTQQDGCTFELSEPVIALHRFKPDRVPATRGQSRRHRHALLMKKLSAIHACLQRKKCFTPMESHWVY